MTRDVLVIGGGIIGLCAARYAAQRGHRVTVLDSGPAGHDGCSYGNGGMIVPSHFVPLAAPGMVALGLKWMWNPESPFYIRPRLDSDLLSWGWKFTRAATAAHVARSAPVLRDLHLASRASYEELAAAFNNDFHLYTRGLLMLCRTRRALDEEARVAELGRKLGVPADVLSAAETARLEPGIRMDIAGAVYFPKDCHLSPRLLMSSLTSRLAGGGVRFEWDTRVTGWKARNGRIESAATSRGEMRADEFVVCGGAWSQDLLRGLGLRLPMQAGKGYSLTLPKPRQLPEICSILTEARVAVTPMSHGLRFAGTMEIAGLDESINPARVRGIIKSVPRYFPDFTPEDFSGIQPWCGLRPCSPDGLPYIGRSGRYRNLIVATGHSMMGVSLGPITGKLVAEMIDGERPSVAIPGLSPDRYDK